MDSEDVYTLPEATFRYYSAKDILRKERRMSFSREVEKELKGVFDDKDTIVSIARMVYLNQKDL